MSAINILYEDMFEVSIIDKTIFFKKDGVVVKNYYIPEKYDIKYIGPASYCIIPKHSRQIVVSYKQDKPYFIPEGYDNLRYYFTGVYRVNSLKYYNSFHKGRISATLHYIDTSLIDLSTFRDLASHFNVYEVEIPDSFWYSSDYRDLSDGWIDLKRAIQYAENFDKDNGSRLISQMELLCIFYFQAFMTSEFEKDGFEIDREEQGDIITIPIFPHLENWDFPAVAGENDYRRMSYFEIDYDKIKYYNDALDLDNCPEQAILPIPVISQKVKK